MANIGKSLLLILFLLCAGWPGRTAETPKAPPKGANEVFVAVLSPQLTPDPVEENLRLYLGSLPGIDYLLEPADPDEMFKMLEKITQDGKKVRYLIIAGHGNANAPNIKFRTDSLRANDVDVPPAQKRLTQTLQLNDRENRLYDNAQDQDARLDIELYIDTVREKWRPFHKKLDDVSDVMADGGEILLLNCSAAATAEGQRMCRNLGLVLLGKGGGSVVASTVDIQIDQAWTWFSILGSPRTGKWVTAGDVWVSGQWVRLDIPAKVDPFLFVAFHDTSLKKARVGETVEISPQVDARRDSGKLLYSWNGGPPSNTPTYSVVVKDNPRHRIDIKVRVQDAQGRVGEDTFTIRIQGVEILGGDRTKPGVALPLKASVFPPREKLTYQWTSAGRTLGDGASIKFVQQNTGKYPVTLEVRDKTELVGTDTRTITVEEEKASTPPPEVDKTTVVVSPLEIMVSDFFELSCQLPARLQSKVAKYEWRVSVGSGEGLAATTETARTQLQLMRQWVGSGFGVRLYDAKGNELDQAWALYKSFTTRKAEFSLSHPGTWKLERREDGSLFLKKEPTLKISDSLKESEGEATYSGDAGGGTLKVNWLSGDELRAVTEGGNLPRDWTLKGDIKQKGAVAFRAKFEPNSWLWPSTGGPNGSKLATQLAEKYKAAVAAHREHTAQQAKDILASLTLTPGGEVVVIPDPGPPKVATTATPTTPTTPTPTTPDLKSQAADKIRQATDALAKGQIDQAVSFAQQASQLDGPGCKQDLTKLAAEMKKQGWDAGHSQDFAKANSALQGSIQLNPTDNDAKAKLAKVDRAEKAWPKVQALGQQVDELVKQRRLVTAYPVLGEMISLANDLLYRGVDMHPYADGVNRRYHARNEEWNKLYQATSEANRERFKNMEYQGVLDSIGPLEAWELNEANRIGVDSLRQSARRGLAQQAQAWQTYTDLKTRLEADLLDRLQTLNGIDHLRGSLQYFNTRDERHPKLVSLIGELEASLKREQLRVAVEPAQLTVQVGQSLETVARVGGGTPPYRIEWLNEDRPTGLSQVSNTWKFANPGRYVVTALVTDARNKQVRGTAVVLVEAPPPIQVRVEPAQVQCKVGQPVLIEGKASGGTPPYRFLWLNEGKATEGEEARYNWTFPHPGRYVLTAVVTDANNNKGQGTTVVVVTPSATASTPPVSNPPVSNPPVSQSGGADRTTTGTSYAPSCHGDPFLGGTWNSSRGGSDWLQRDFSTPRSVSEIRIERAGTDVTTEGSSIEILLHTPGGSWVRLDRLNNTNINWVKLTGGGQGRSIPTYSKVLSAPMVADAVRVNLTGNGWFVASNIQVLTHSAGKPSTPAPAQGTEVLATLSNESGQNVHIFAQGDSFGPHNRLTPGEQRQVRLRMGSDGRIRFVCGRNGQVISATMWNGDPDNPSRYPRVIFTRQETLVVLTGLR